jgi:hypothetical protein
MSITPLHTFGWAKEEQLFPAIQASVGEPIIKTAVRYANFDWHSEHNVVELKSRRVSSDAYSTWIVPACKLKPVKNKKIILFYYFEKDKTLWRCDPEEHDQTDWLHDTPPHWSTTQEFVWVPREVFTQIPLQNEPSVKGA